MPVISFYGLFVIGVFMSWPIQAQNIIYTVQEQAIPAKVTEISDAVIKYKDPESPGDPKLIERRKALMAFNENGDYIVFAIGSATSSSSSKSFLKTGVNRKYDLLITLDNKVIPSLIDKDEEEELTYKRYSPTSNKVSGNPTLISKFELSAIIYKDGRHELLASPADAANILSSVRKQVDDLGRLENSKTNTTHSATPAFADQTATETAAAATPSASAAKVSKDEMPFDFDEYRDKALRRVREFNQYLEDITNKNTSVTEATKFIGLACDLFVDNGKNSRIEVSKAGLTKKDKYLVHVYLDKLKYTKYDRVKVEWAKIQYVSQLRKGANGDYYGVVSFEQTFEGFIESRVIYKDITKKNVEVIVKRYTKEASGNTEERWDAFLSDIAVVETWK